MAQSPMRSVSPARFLWLAPACRQSRQRALRQAVAPIYQHYPLNNSPLHRKAAAASSAARGRAACEMPPAWTLINRSPTATKAGEPWSAWHVRSNRYHAIMQAWMRYPFNGRLPSTAAGRLPSTAAGRPLSTEAERLPSARAGRLPSARAGRLPSTITGRLTFLTLLALHWRHRPLLQPCLVGWRLACSSKCRLASRPEGAEEQLARCKLLRAALRFGGKCHRYCSARESSQCIWLGMASALVVRVHWMLHWVIQWVAQWMVQWIVRSGQAQAPWSWTQCA